MPGAELRKINFSDRLLDPESGTRLYKVWYGTNRKPIFVDNKLIDYSNTRDESVHYGYCNVSIPKSHKFGSVGPKWWKKWLRLTNDQDLKIVECKFIEDEVFWESLVDAVESDPDQNCGLIFLHGYRNSFEDAALRAAQIGFDLKIAGHTAFFSWASSASLFDYPADEATIEASEPYIAKFIVDFCTRTKFNRVHLIAYSMGNRGLLRAIQRIVASTQENSDVRFGQIILAAPDVDSSTFRDLASILPSISDRTTLYSSDKDAALAMSKWLHTYPRAGFAPPITIVNGIDTVFVPKIDLSDAKWHSYFAEATSLLNDMYSLIQHNSHPDKRIRLKNQVAECGNAYWSFID